MPGMKRALDFERPVLELERQIEELRRLAAGRDRLAAVVETGEAESPKNKKRALAMLGRKGKKGSAKHKSQVPIPNGAALEEQIRALEQRARTLKEQIF